ncbi:MAG: hypothetical protein KF760_17745 [Candidatus Eremiobacteraeota bacterium]|nr:hypothetical protein [Candidatus Eremiobacteraeota bacterium]MCW5867949.1 hypothetical protein [Candidatus Eremiobacteraeota bacterium]
MELALRWFFPGMVMGAGSQLQFRAGERANFQADPECGYIPVLGNAAYDRFGCRVDRYDEKGRRLPDRDGSQPRQGKRILFVGDSVTRRGRIQDALEKHYGKQDYEYWNAGVESFNTMQELVFYRRVNSQLKPDQVILTFHNNDFQDTPLVFRENGELQIHFMRRDGQHINAWLFSHSYLYRWLTGLSLGNLDRARQRAAVKEALAGFRQITSQQKVPFSVILLPILKPYEQWTNKEKWSRQNALELLKEEGITTYDLFPDMEAALKEGVDLPESPGDSWHPGVAAAEHFARYLVRQKILR